MMMDGVPMKFTVISECPVTKARVSSMAVPHHVVDTPVFMPVGTQGSLKGMSPKQLESMGCQIMLGNAYHLGNRPGPSLLEAVGGLHNFMGWNRALLTDSGGFQMVSLLKLATITEDGVEFQSPHNDSMMLLTPEHSMQLQNAIGVSPSVLGRCGNAIKAPRDKISHSLALLWISWETIITGADIMMQLDDVVHVLTTGPRVEEAMLRSVRWLDRSIAAHKRPSEQNLFAIIQGGLDFELRRRCVEEMVKRHTPGYAIGGLSGGEDKQQFWKIVSYCTDLLPHDKPRYLMGVGYAVDLVVCSALGVDMYDCVYPTRTARFGTALVPWGQLQLKNKKYLTDFTPIDPDCTCRTCARHSRSFLHSLLSQQEPLACDLVTVHNIHYQLQLMKGLRDSVQQRRFPEFVKKFMKTMYPGGDYPAWCIDALRTVNIVI